MTYDDAVAQLFRADHAGFVAERKRLAAEVKGSGDKEGAARLAKLGRPPISAWVVNQLWWKAREDFDEVFSTAAKVRAGELAALPAHKAAIARLRARASELLTAAGHAAADNTLRRVDVTLCALAVAGNFDPDPPGALTEDRDPPGFASLGVPAPAPVPSAPRKTEPPPEDAEAARAARAQAEADEAAARALREAAEAQAAEAAARAKREAAQRDVDRLRVELGRLEAALAVTRAALASAERSLTELP